jgi:hypothetical protein
LPSNLLFRINSAFPRAFFQQFRFADCIKRRREDTVNRFQKIALLLLAGCMVLLLVGCPQRTTVAKINGDPGAYFNKEVALVGTVSRSYGLLGNGIYQLNDGTARGRGRHRHPYAELRRQELRHRNSGDSQAHSPVIFCATVPQVRAAFTLPRCAKPVLCLRSCLVTKG